jgi:hypothetical protein
MGYELGDDLRGTVGCQLVGEAHGCELPRHDHQALPPLFAGLC